MIERKNVKHDIPKEDSLYVKDILSYVYVTETSNVKADNEEAIRCKLYGDVVDELQSIKQEMYLDYSKKWIVGRIKKLIDTLEWRE